MGLMDYRSYTFCDVHTRILAEGWRVYHECMEVHHPPGVLIKGEQAGSVAKIFILMFIIVTG